MKNFKTNFDVRNFVNAQFTSREAKKIFSLSSTPVYCLQKSGNWDTHVSMKISNFYKKNRAIRHLEVSRHFYSSNSHANFYVVLTDNSTLCGFVIYSDFHVEYSECEVTETILALECIEDMCPPRTLGDVFKEWSK